MFAANIKRIATITGMAKVYLETSFFSACVTTRTTPKSLGWQASSLEWWDIERMHHELFVSTEVVRELSDPVYPNGQRALEMLQNLNLLRPDEVVENVAALLIAEKVMPGPSVAGDALHVAFAIVSKMDFILTWNIKHLANPNKRVHLAAFCMRLGVPVPQLVTADLLKGDES